MVCNKCGCNDFYLEKKGTQTGVYCCKCRSWLKWVGKKEINTLRYEAKKPYDPFEPEPNEDAVSTDSGIEFFSRSNGAQDSAIDNFKSALKLHIADLNKAYENNDMGMVCDLAERIVKVAYYLSVKENQ